MLSRVMGLQVQHLKALNYFHEKFYHRSFRDPKYLSTSLLTSEICSMLPIMALERRQFWCLFWLYFVRVTSCELRVESLKAGAEIQKCELKLKSTSYAFKSTSYEFKPTSYEFESTSYEFESTSSRIIYQLFINHYQLIIISSRVQKSIKQP